jgi:hypothetical protein
MRKATVVPLVISIVALLARPVAVHASGSVAALTCFADLSGRWEVRLTAPGYSRLTAFTWNFDSEYSSGPIGWQPARQYWWGGPDRVWWWPLPQDVERPEGWLGPIEDTRVLYGTHNSGTIYVNEYQWNGQAWERYEHQCALAQWVPSLPYGFSWPSYL